MVSNLYPALIILHIWIVSSGLGFGWIIGQPGALTIDFCYLRPTSNHLLNSLTHNLVCLQKAIFLLETLKNLKPTGTKDKYKENVAYTMR